MPMFNDWNRAMKELRFLNAINMYGPRQSQIAKGLGVTLGVYRTWITSATYRWKGIYEDDGNRIFYDPEVSQ